MSFSGFKIFYCKHYIIFNGSQPVLIVGGHTLFFLGFCLDDVKLQ